ncbi:hypothetical protein IMSHALPRED_003934 [Imshaugia aleurites]|uniref:Uncharacterized protein n=1 Tax=Imshaugia aleurites TaxID=172621 RepID=A0A8H3EHB6_9LECA|nr:hypothetical protein IMSHALPRED_003934 [Imshaugia aleurites]
MNTLPLELLRDICDNFKGKKSTLKAVRLVNKTLADVAAPLLFQTLLVYQTPKSWEKLSSIANCEWLAPCVTKLEVAALDYLPHYLDFVDWKQYTWRSRWNDCCDQRNRAGMVSVLAEKLENQLPRQIIKPNPYTRFQTWQQYPGVRGRHNQRYHGDAASMIPKAREQVETLLPGLDSALGLVYRYGRYRYWHDGENEISDIVSRPNGPHPPLSLIPFPGLRTVEVLGAHELWKDMAWPLARANRKARETAVHVIARPNMGRMQRNVQLSLTVQLLDASEVKITRLKLHRYRDILADRRLSVPPIKHLQELMLDFPFSANYDELSESHEGEQFQLSSWLRNAEHLSTLIIVSQDPKAHKSHQFLDLIALFHETEWPKLRSIHFKETFVRPQSLLRFLSEHSQSLESIRIEKPIMSNNAWQSLAAEFQALKFSSPDCVVDIGAADPDSDKYRYEGRGIGDDRSWIHPDIWNLAPDYSWQGDGSLQYEWS